MLGGASAATASECGDAIAQLQDNVRVAANDARDRPGRDSTATSFELAFGANLRARKACASVTETTMLNAAIHRMGGDYSLVFGGATPRSAK